MAKFIVRSFVSVEYEVEAPDREEAEHLAGVWIQSTLSEADIDFMEEAIVYDENGEEVEITE